MNAKRISWLVAVVLLLAAWAVSHQRARARAQVGRLPQVLAYNAADVSKVQIEREGGSLWLARVGTHAQRVWMLEKPNIALADAVQVADLLRLLNQTSVAEVVGARGKPLKSFGLDRPTLSLTLGTEDGKSRTLLVGRRVAADRVYLKPKDRPVVFAARAAGIDALANAAASDLRDKTIFSFAPEDVVRLDLSTSGRTIRLESVGRGIWRITAPIRAKAKSARVDEILFSLRSLRGWKIIAENPSDLRPYGLNPPQAKVSIWMLGAKQPDVAFLGNRNAEGEVYARSGWNRTVVLLQAYSHALADAQTPLSSLSQTGPVLAAASPASPAAQPSAPAPMTEPQPVSPAAAPGPIKPTGTAVAVLPARPATNLGGAPREKPVAPSHSASVEAKRTASAAGAKRTAPAADRPRTAAPTKRTPPTAVTVGPATGGEERAAPAKRNSPVGARRSVVAAARPPAHAAPPRQTPARAAAGRGAVTLAARAPEDLPASAAPPRGRSRPGRLRGVRPGAGRVDRGMEELMAIRRMLLVSLRERFLARSNAEMPAGEVIIRVQNDSRVPQGFYIEGPGVAAHTPVLAVGGRMTLRPRLRQGAYRLATFSVPAPRRNDLTHWDTIYIRRK